MKRSVKRTPSPVVVVATHQKENGAEEPGKRLIINQRGPLEGRDEMNLVELPFSLVSYRNNSQIKTIESRWTAAGEDGKRRDFYEVVTGSDKWGLPTFQAEELLIAALELTHRQGFDEPQIHTTKYELMMLMQWPNTGQYRRALLDAFGQIVGTTIATNHFWDKVRQRYAEVSFHVMDEYRFYEDERKRSRVGGGQMSLPLSSFIWGETFWNSLQAGYVKALDTATYFSLSSPLSRRLYRYADKHLHNGGLEIDLFVLASAKLVMSGNYRYPSKVIEKLQPAIDELNQRKLADIRIVRSKTTSSGYKVTIQGPAGSRKKGTRALTGEEDQESPATTVPDSSAAEQALVVRGITLGAAVELVRAYPERVARQVEVFDWIQQHQPDTIKDSPAGYLRRMIEQDWTAPEGFAGKDAPQEQPWDPAQAERALAAEYQQALAEVEQEVDEFLALPPTQQIALKLELWETGFQQLYQRAPTPKEKERKKTALLKDLPNREDLLADRLKDLCYQFERKAAEHGIAFRA